MSKAYVIKFNGGGYRGNGHAHAVSLYKADFFNTYNDAESAREELSKYWSEMYKAKVVEVKESEE